MGDCTYCEANCGWGRSVHKACKIDHYKASFKRVNSGVGLKATPTHTGGWLRDNFVMTDLNVADLAILESSFPNSSDGESWLWMQPDVTVHVVKPGQEDLTNKDKDFNKYKKSMLGISDQAIYTLTAQKPVRWELSSVMEVSTHKITTADDTDNGFYVTMAKTSSGQPDVFGLFIATDGDFVEISAEWVTNLSENTSPNTSSNSSGNWASNVPHASANVIDRESFKLEDWDLHKAASENRIDVVSALIERGDDINDCSSFPLLALHAAAENDYVDLARFLIAEGSEIDNMGQTDQTPLQLASRSCSNGVAEELIKAGADVNAHTDFEGKVPVNHRPIQLAVLSGCWEILKLLVDAGADINAPDKNGETVLDYAITSTDVALADYLISNNANPRGRDLSWMDHEDDR